LRQRITISTHISPLARKELESYITFRLGVAGNEEAVTFEEGVFDAIYDFSKGIPRLINILCDFTLLTAFTDDKKIVDMELIQEVINDLVNERPETKAAHSSTECGISADNFEKIEKGLASIHVRLQNLEAVISDMQKKNDIYDNKKRLLALVNACSPSKPFSFSFDESKNIMNIKRIELNKKEAELQKMEHELYEKDSILNKRKLHAFLNNEKKLT
jgi:hypothetical protein